MESSLARGWFVEVGELSEVIFNQRTSGFIKAFALATFFFDISSNHEGFDMMKWVVNGQLVSIQPTE